MNKKRRGFPAVKIIPVFSRKALDIIRQKTYNIITGKGKPSNKERSGHHRKGGENVTEEQIKELLDLLRKAIESDTVERITITIKPKQKTKQS